MQKRCSFVEPTREMGSFRAVSYKCLSILAEGVLGKCCMPALSLLRVLPPTPALIVHFPLLVNLSDYSLCVGYHQAQRSMPVFHK